MRAARPLPQRHPWVLHGLENPDKWLADTEPTKLGLIEVTDEEVSQAYSIFVRRRRPSPCTGRDAANHAGCTPAMPASVGAAQDKLRSRIRKLSVQLQSFVRGGPPGSGRRSPSPGMLGSHTALSASLESITLSRGSSHSSIFTPASLAPDLDSIPEVPDGSEGNPPPAAEESAGTARANSPRRPNSSLGRHRLRLSNPFRFHRRQSTESIEVADHLPSLPLPRELTPPPLEPPSSAPPSS